MVSEVALLARICASFSAAVLIFSTSSPLAETVSEVASTSTSAPPATICPAAMWIVAPDAVILQPSSTPSEIVFLISRIKFSADIGCPFLVMSSDKDYIAPFSFRIFVRSTRMPPKISIFVPPFTV